MTMTVQTIDSLEENEKWQLIQSDGPFDETYRMSVPGGWLYRVLVMGSGDMLMQMAFVPDCRECAARRMSGAHDHHR
jgi:hypothetical protein